MSKPTPLSGFPEWLPSQRLIEQEILGRVQRTFELYGFAPLETRAVEPLDQLLRKGETSKEVYVLRRLQADENDTSDNELGLHFDLTVPFARFVLENAGKLHFPFRRYQIQKVWRGERPQEGRYREFYQADIDIVDRDTLPAHYEAEIPLVIGDALGGLPIPKVTIQVNNRKILEGFYRGLGIESTEEVLRQVDKLDKVGPAKVAEMLTGQGLSEAQAAKVLKLAEITSPDGSFADDVKQLGISDPLLDEGLEELVRVVDTAVAQSPGLVVADLRIARGLDYYTGTVYETVLAGYERFGSISSGGRYDNLATSGKDVFPGVGISIGITRLLGILYGRDALSVSRSVPTAVLVAVTSEEERSRSVAAAAALRRNGVPAEVVPTAAKFGKQIRYAERRGIPYVWFPGSAETGSTDSVKDIRSGEQADADASTWTPPQEDLRPIVTGTV